MPTTPAANGVSSKLVGATLDDADRREKRMKRFVNGNAAAGPSTANGAANSASLSERLSFGRLAQAGKSGYGGANMYGSSEVEAVYDPVSRLSAPVRSFAACLRARACLGQWNER